MIPSSRYASGPLLLYHGFKAGLPTMLNQWWESIPFLTSAVVGVCGVIYFVCLLIGYDSFVEICFLPSAVVSRFQGLLTRLNQWWESIPFLTSAVVGVSGVIYFVCLLIGYDSFVEICFLPSAIVSGFQEAGLPTRLNQWWESIPFLTSAVMFNLSCPFTHEDLTHVRQVWAEFFIKLYAERKPSSKEERRKQLK